MMEAKTWWKQGHKWQWIFMDVRITPIAKALSDVFHTKSWVNILFNIHRDSYEETFHAYEMSSEF